MKLLTTARFTDKDMESLRAVSPDVEIIREYDDEKARAIFREVDAFCGYQLPAPVSEAPRLKWVQLVSAGAEHVFKMGILESDVLVTTASGVHVHAMSEYALAAMVMLARRIPQIMKEIEQRQWRPQRQRFYYGEELYGKTVGVLGLGAIGQQVATSCRCLGMKIMGMRRGAANGVADEVYGPDRLMEMLPQCDFVVIALPLTKETTGFIGERELQAMKKSAYLVNMARGRIVDEQALVRALREGWIAGAAIDTFAQEPLSEDSDLWEVPNLLITPHIAGNFSAYLDRVMDILRENLKRYLADEPMINVLDKKRGY